MPNFVLRIVPPLSLGILLSVAPLTSCFTPQKSTTASTKKKKALVMRDKPGAKNAGEDPGQLGKGGANAGEGPAGATPVVAAAPPPIAPLGSLERRQASFVQTQLTEFNKPVTDDDERSVLPGTAESTTSGSLGEACAVVAISKRVLATGPIKTSGFVEQDTATDKSKSGTLAETKSPALIETMSQQRFIDFTRALEINAFLQNPAAQKLALKALEKSSDSQAFKDRAYASMRRVSDQWTSHMVNLGRAMGTAVAVTAVPGDPAAATNPNAAAGSAPPPFLQQ